MFSFRLTSAAGIITSAQAIIANSTGTVTYVGDWTIHTFTTSGSFTFQSITGNPTIEYLVVGGGGGGGGGQSVNGGGSSGGGGGAGGFKLGSRVIQVAETLSITVGDGGIAGVSNNIYMSTLPSAGGQGNASQIIGPNFASIAGNGGGGGSGRMLQAGTGGSGGGGGPTNRNGSGLPGHGYGGGLGFPLHTTTDAMRSGGGGGGALGVGNNATSLTVAGTGGPGGSTSISGTTVTYAQGGNGLASGASSTLTVPRPPNLGHGGHGATRNNTVRENGNGSSGIVIIRYLTN